MSTFSFFLSNVLCFQLSPLSSYLSHYEATFLSFITAFIFFWLWTFFFFRYTFHVWTFTSVFPHHFQFSLNFLLIPFLPSHLVRSEISFSPLFIILPSFLFVLAFVGTKSLFLFLVYYRTSAFFTLHQYFLHFTSFQFTSRVYFSLNPLFFFLSTIPCYTISLLSFALYFFAFFFIF